MSEKQFLAAMRTFKESITALRRKKGDSLAISDADDLARVYNLLSRDRWADAERAWQRLDTNVREMLPMPLYYEFRRLGAAIR